MECPRCGEDNIPGLERCFGCGRELAGAEPDVATRPRVRAANPLRPTRPPQSEGAAFRIRDRGLLMFGEIMRAALHGIPPGLGALQRGDRRGAAILAGGFLACIVAWFLLWRSAVQPLAWAAAVCVLASSCLTEVRARLDSPAFSHSIAGFGFSLSLALCLHVVVVWVMDSAWPRISVPTTPALDAGHFIVERVAASDLAIDDLVAVGFLTRWWQLTPQPVQVAPVLALPGQTITREGRAIYVDGEPTPVHPLNPNVGMPLILAPMAVPAGHVAVLTSPIQVVRPDRIAGRLTYRWMPQSDRGPLLWPPPEPGPEP